MRHWAAARAVICVAVMLAFATGATAGEKKLLHCFAFTPLDAATDADWQAFYKATDALPGKIPGLSKVWYGKLLRPLPQFGTDGETRKKLGAGETSVTGPVTREVRQHGVCMEMADEAAFKAYGSHPEHKAWVDAYSKVRKPGTTTYQILGQ